MAGLLYESILEDIITKIKTGDLAEGERLSERGLAEKYGVSRTVARDALKVLDEKKYMETHPGKGHYVKRPDGNDFCGKLTNIIVNSTIPYKNVLEARELIETSMADMITERATKKDVDELSDLFNRMQGAMDDRVAYNELDRQFHIRLMSCAQNEMLLVFVRTLNDTINRDSFMWDRETREQAQREHQDMLQALAARDSEKIKRSFKNHIHCIEEHIY